MAEIASRAEAQDSYTDPHSPYEMAVRETELRTGQPRTEWEPVIGHPLVLETDRRARHLAGIPEEPPVPPRGMNVARYHNNRTRSHV